MANDTFTRFNYYRRYKWRAADFTDLQENLIRAVPNAMTEGLIGGGVIKGGDLSLGVLSVSVNPFIALGPTGDVLVVNSVSFLPVTPPMSMPTRSLVVARPVITDDTLMPRPTNPFDTVPLRELQTCNVVLLQGTEAASATYPTKQPGDVVLFGIRLDDPSMVSMVPENIDWEIRDQIGKNSTISKAVGHFDDRLRPYFQAVDTIGLKPSQVITGGAQLFSYVAKGRVSKYPLGLSGDFNNSDSFINFTTGAITGGDAQTPALTPSIPAAGKYRVATVALQTNDILQFAFGADGTFQQCVNSIRNRVTVGAGSVNLLKLPMVCYCIIGSFDGVSITSLDLFDARTIFASGGTETVGAHEIPTGMVDGSNKTFILSQIPLSLESVLVYIDGIKLPPSGYSLNNQTITLVDAPVLGQSIEVFYLQDGVGAFNAPNQAGSNSLIPVQETPMGTINGMNPNFILTQAPYSNDSLQVYIDGLEVPKSKRMLGGAVIAFDPTYIPQPGQDVQAFYFITANLVMPPTGGGGNGAYEVSGSPASPTTIVAAVGVIPTADARQLWFINSSGGAQAVSAIPQVEAGSAIGQELTLIGTSDVNYISLADGNGLSLNGAINMKNKMALSLIWDSVVWSEVSRR